MLDTLRSNEEKLAFYKNNEEYLHAEQASIANARNMMAEMHLSPMNFYGTAQMIPPAHNLVPFPIQNVSHSVDSSSTPTSQYSNKKKRKRSYYQMFREDGQPR